MQGLAHRWIWIGFIVICGGVIGCGMPPTQEQTLSQQHKAFIALQTLAQTALAQDQLHPLLSWEQARPVHLSQYATKQTAPHQTTTTNQAASISTLRYVTFQVDWRGAQYLISTDLQALQYELTIRRTTLSLRLLCVPGRAEQTKKVEINLPKTVGLQQNQPGAQNDIATFERNALALAYQVWNPMKQLWNLGRCRAQQRCNSELFSDITLDIQSEPQFQCQMKLLEPKKSAP